MESSRNFLLHAHLIPGIGPVFLKNLGTVVGHAFAQCYCWSVRDFMERTGCSEKLAAGLVAGLRDFSLLERELEVFEKNKISWCTLFDPAYPALLSEIYAPPVILSWRGDLASCSGLPAVAFVGSRDASVYVQQVADQIVTPLARAGVVIVSGGARGADAYAHTAALAGDGKTIAVIGSGLQHVYPREHARLFNNIVARGGAVLSAFPYHMRPVAGNFPARNRIIAGLTSLTVVLQAAQKSGALITAQCALDAGRDVGAVPGSIFDPLSAGCHDLIAQGAAIICTAETVLSLCGWSSLSSSKAPGSDDLQIPVFSEEKDPLLEACKEPRYFDELRLLFPDLAHDVLQERLFELQLLRLLDHDFMGRFVAI